MNSRRSEIQGATENNDRCLYVGVATVNWNAVRHGLAGGFGRLAQAAGRGEIAGVLLAASLSGCAIGPGADAWDSVEPGMNEVQITAALGAPDSRQLAKESAVWQFCRPGAVVHDAVDVWFADGAAGGAIHGFAYGFDGCNDWGGTESDSGYSN